MNRHHVQLLDLPNEILFFILKNLDNINVLYSLLGISNQRLDTIAQEQIFSSTLNFVSISQLADEISSRILDRFCVSILPRIHQNIKSLVVEPVSMERIFGTVIYPNLSQLKLFNFNKKIISRYFMDDSLLGHACKQQITDLILVSNETDIEITYQEYTTDVYAIVFPFFVNLKHFSIVSSSVNDYPPLSLYFSPPSTFSSSTLTKLRIIVFSFYDIHALLDGRLKQLTTFIVQVRIIGDEIPAYHNKDNLTNLKCFSLTCYKGTSGYDSLVVTLLRRMSYLEELTLYIYITGGSPFVAGTDLDNEILIHMPHLHTFTFYMASHNNISLSYNSYDERHLRDKDWCSIVEYPHLISLDIEDVHPHYVEHLLNETKTLLPRLTQLKVTYDHLKFVSENFTRDETRRNCVKVKQLTAIGRKVYPKDIVRYFPLLSL